MTEQTSVLVVDDNTDLADTFSQILKLRGYNVATAEDGISAVDKFKTRHFDVILMDIIMPKMNGVEAFRKIREIDPKARVILMTAYYEEEELRKARDEGVFSTVHKPIDIARLMELIKEATLNLPILIVDDDIDFCRTMARTLELKGYRVEAASSGEEAVRLARKKQFQIAFVDVKMPFMDGPKTCLKLKEINSNIVAVLMTAYRDEMHDSVAKAVAAKAATCLYKPLDFPQVVKLLNQISQ